MVFKSSVSRVTRRFSAEKPDSACLGYAGVL